MPIIIPQEMPAYSTLASENIFVMNETRAERQDIRPIEIAILNLMPTKVETETQLIRMLSNSPLQIRVTLVGTESYVGTHAPEHHLEKFYKTFSEIKDRRFDGGAAQIYSATVTCHQSKSSLMASTVTSASL